MSLRGFRRNPKQSSLIDNEKIASGLKALATTKTRFILQSLRGHGFRLGLAIFLCLLASCTVELDECNGPALNLDRILAEKFTLNSVGPTAGLIVPNPIDATGNPMAKATDSSLVSAFRGFSLPDLSSSSLLQNSFIRVRIRSIEDSLSTLARPNSNGAYIFPISDAHYSEVMAYYATNAAKRYVEALGFKLLTDRPLYIMVRSEDPNENDPLYFNAFYEHNTFHPGEPRAIRLIGTGAFAPGIDRDSYVHEFGHFVNESVSFETGFDMAGEKGAIYTEGSALHECMADYLAESIGNQGYIGKWVARNDPQIPAGAPLRSAEDAKGKTLQYGSIAENDGKGFNPKRYTVAEWCTRVLWDIRTQLTKGNSKTGSIHSDRLMLSAMGLLSRDTSFRKFRSALLKADEKLYCGLHRRSIEKAFEVRGFQSDPSELDKPIQITNVEAIGFQFVGDNVQLGAPVPGGQLTFAFKLRNPNSTTARNVRVVLESPDRGLHITTYLQGFGDMAAGRVLDIGGDSGLSINQSLFGEIESTATRGIRYRLRVQVENGPESVFEGSL